MSRVTELFEYLRTCPQLNDLWSIGATEEVGVSVILPQGASQVYQYLNERTDTLGNYNCDIVPFPSVYEDYQINLYKPYYSGDQSSPEYNINVLNYDECQSICDWIMEQNEEENLPSLTGIDVVSIECNPVTPQVLYVNVQEDVIGYFITVRLRYVNKYKGRPVEIEK